MNIIKRLFHRHSFESFITDRYVVDGKVIEMGVFVCSCGEVSCGYETMGDIFRNREIPTERTR